MTVTCPEGHQSEATDYCDTCGTPIVAASVSAASAGGASAGPSGSALELDEPEPVATVTCPHCGGVNVADALFCEACGYDFTTGTPPIEDDPVPEVEEPEVQPDVEEPEVEPEVEEPEVEELDVEESEAEPQGDDPESEDLTPDGEPDVETPTPDGTGPEQPDAGGEEAVAEGAEAEVGEPGPAEPGTDAPQGQDAPSGSDEAGPEPGPAPVVPTPPPAREATPSHARPRHTPPSRALADAWVVEVWVDPDWYAVQQTAEACPSAGVPDIVVVRRNVVLIGRPSGSLGVRPDVDAGADSAVSRRHAQLTSDGRRWWIEDLGSSNGTYIGTVGEPLPSTPVTPGVRVEIDRDDRIYVGAWTRLVVRQATASEQAGQG